MKRQLYFLFLTIFILYVVFAAIPSDAIYIDWYPLYSQKVTIQYYVWLLVLRLVMFLIFFAWYHESKLENRKMLKVMAMIHAWYVLEYILHYTSVWVTWKQLGLGGNDFDGISSHIFTMSVFAYYGWDD